MRKPSRSVPASPKARGKSASLRRSGDAVPAKWQPFQRKLVALRDSLLSHNRELVQEAREPIGTAGSHVAETGTDEFDRNQNLRIAASEMGVLSEIEDALTRIKRGTYGVCEVSGKSIPLARLRVLPWTRYTAAVESEREKGNGNRGIAQKTSEVPSKPSSRSTGAQRLRKAKRSA